MREQYAADPERFRERNKAWKDANPDKVSGYFRRLKYGMEEGEFEQMLEEQGGLCAAESCTRPGTHVDHDHGTGRVRGILCNWCNRGLGLFSDDPALLRSAAAYVEKHAT